jgi:YggT family protein
MRILGGALSLYSLLIFIRIMLSWFSGLPQGRAHQTLCGITDPYLNWWRRFRFLRLGHIDLSPVAALAALGVVSSIVQTAAQEGRVSPGFVLATILQAVWSAASFILGFFAVIIALRLAAYFFRANIYSPFWRVIAALSEPLLYRINRLFFPRRILPFVNSMFIALGFLLALFLAAGAGVRVLTLLLLGQPVIPF